MSSNAVTKMLLIHHFNTTYFKTSTDYYPQVYAYLIFETIVYIIDTINISFYLYIVFRASQFHFNFNMISGSQYFLHICDNISIIIMRFLMIFDKEDDMDIESNIVFTSAMSFTEFTLVSGMCSLPFFIIERCFASYFLEDYERKLRAHISIGLITLFTLFGASGAFFLKDKRNMIYIFCILIGLNSVSLVINFYLRYWNRVQYDELHDLVPRFHRAPYSLAKRFQIAENIKSLRMLTLIITFMGFMNGVLIFSFLFSSYDLTPEQHAINTLVLNISIFIYSFTLPQIMTCCCDKWQYELRNVMKKIGFAKKSNSGVISPLRDTFGAEMKAKASTNAYFDSLKSTWDMPPNKLKG